MTAVLSLARHTLLDALRERVFRTLAVFLLVLFAAAQLVKPLALGEGRRVTLDLGLGLVSLAGLLLVLFLGPRAVQREIERRTILVLLARPLRRGELLLGKYLGMWAVTAIALAGMFLILGLVLLLSGYGLPQALPAAGLLAALELGVLCALSLLVTSLAGPALAGVVLLALFIAGRLAPSLLDAARLLPDAPAALLGALFRLLPRLDLFTAGLEAVHGATLPAGVLLWAAAYALLYSAAILLIALLVLRRREFA
jgi:ABC-type transport system involved in multi-copper enzyme maturation permease subunit